MINASGFPDASRGAASFTQGNERDPAIRSGNHKLKIRRLTEAKRERGRKGRQEKNKASQSISNWKAKCAGS